MPIVVQELWSTASLSIVPPWKAYREFTVTGTTNQKEAVEAEGIPQRGDPHNRNPVLTAEGPRIVRVLGPEYFHVGVDYTQSEKDSFDGDPLNKIAELSWGTTTISEPVDRDLDHRVIQNTAGFLLPGVTGEREYDTLTVMYFAPYYDQTLNKRFRNSVNLKPMTVDDMPVDAQHMHCVRIVPAGAYRSGDRFIQMRAEFNICFDDSLGTYPFQHRLLDAGPKGNFNDDGTIRPRYFSDGRGEILHEDVRLDGVGKPLTKVHASVKVGETNADPVSPLNPVSVLYKEFFDNAGVKGDALTANTVATFIYFKKRRVVDLTPLLELLNQKIRQQRT
jgi:hypothetical protein